MTGRKTKCTEALTDELCMVLRNGNFVSVACQFVGITDRSYYNWMNRGEEELQRREDGLEPDETKECYVRFVREVTRALAAAEVGAVAALRQGFRDDWRAAAEYLGRRNPERWSKRREVVHASVGHGSRLAEALEDDEAGAQEMMQAYILRVTESGEE